MNKKIEMLYGYEAAIKNDEHGSSDCSDYSRILKTKINKEKILKFFSHHLDIGDALVVSVMAGNHIIRYVINNNNNSRKENDMRYTEAVKNKVKTNYLKGLGLTALSNKFDIPMSTVQSWTRTLKSKKKASKKKAKKK